MNKKRIVVYNIPNEADRLKLEAAIDELDGSAVTVIQDRAILFHSDKNLDDLSRVQIELGAEGECWFFEVTGDAVGFGIAQGEVQEFMKRRI